MEQFAICDLVEIFIYKRWNKKICAIEIGRQCYDKAYTAGKLLLILSHKMKCISVNLMNSRLYQ